MRNYKIRQITITAFLAALSTILYYFVKFPLALIIPIIPPFLEVNFSMVPVLLGGYMVGPIYGFIIVLIRFLVKLPSSTTACVGELADLLIGAIVVVVSSIIYQNHKTKKGAFFSLLFGCLSWIGASLAVNAFILIPTYINLYFNGNIDGLVGLLSALPGITAENYLAKYTLYGALPFNSILSIVVCIITFIVYKPLHRLIIAIAGNAKPKVECDKDNERKINIKIKIVKK